MKKLMSLSLWLVGATLLLNSCGGEKDKNSSGEMISSDATKTEYKMNTYISGDLEGIDQDLAAEGKEIFDIKCTACHSMDTRLVGPPLAGITERRTPNWLMNIMLHNEDMVIHNEEAKAVFEEYNKTIMLVEDFYEEDARKVLEYMRQYDASQG